MRRASRLVLLAACVVLIGGTPALAGEIKGSVTAKRDKFLENTVIYVEEVKDKEFKPDETPSLMDQVNMTFVPHVLPVLVGTTVSFKNSDKVLHNVFSPDKCANKFNLGSWPQGETREFTFKEPGCTPVLLCNVHPEMEAFILVLQNPYFAVTDKEGSFTIPDVPAGKYTINVWHEKLKAESCEATVPKEGSVEVSFALAR
jgi:plastocyanin